MSATGLDVFDKTLQTTHIWLDDIMAELGPDRQVAWKVLSVVLHKLRDRLPVDAAAHLGAQLPILVRGVYYDQFHPARQPSGCDTIEDLTAEVAEWLRDVRPVDPKAAIHAVFGVLLRHVDRGQITKIQNVLPASIRDAWQAVETQPELAPAEG